MSCILCFVRKLPEEEKEEILSTLFFMQCIVEGITINKILVYK